MQIIVNVLLAIVVCMVAHEGGHFLAARAFGHTVKFRFALAYLFEKVPVPRFIWDMPDMEPWKQKVTALAGFVTEFIAAFVAGHVCLLVACVHLGLYRFYAKGESDFKWL